MSELDMGQARRFGEWVIKIYKHYHNNMYEYGNEELFLERMERLMMNEGVIE